MIYELILRNVELYIGEDTSLLGLRLIMYNNLFNFIFLAFKFHFSLLLLPCYFYTSDTNTFFFYLLAHYLYYITISPFTENQHTSLFTTDNGELA